MLCGSIRKSETKYIFDQLFFERSLKLRYSLEQEQASLSERSVSRKPGDAAFSLARIGLKGKQPCQHSASIKTSTTPL